MTIALDEEDIDTEEEDAAEVVDDVGCKVAAECEVVGSGGEARRKLRIRGK